MMISSLVRVVFVSLFSFLAYSCIQSGIGGSFLNFSGNRIVLESTDDLYQLLTYDDRRFPLISAHRGGPTSGYPENAIETFAHNIKKQPLIIECDIRMTKDSVLILMHDERLERTSTGKGKISDFNYTELAQLWLKDPDGKLTDFRIPTLDEALAWGKQKVVFTLDVKKNVPYQLVVDAIRRNDAGPFSVVITYSADQAAEVYRMAPELMISASIRSAGDLLRLNDRDIPDNRLVAFVGTSEVEKGLYELLHGHGIMCILGTMGNLDKQADTKGSQVYVELVTRGADILSTDRPREAGQALENHRKQKNISSKFIH